MGGAREALIIGTGRYDDARLRALRSPARDVQELARVLADPTIGGFNVRTAIDQTENQLSLQIHDFFADRRRDDLLVLHLSCHGIKDDEGCLYFAGTDTRMDVPAATAVSAEYVNGRMSNCRARSIILLLDCCYSGAFAAGSKGDSGVHLKDQFAGSGRAILTASNALEYSWEGEVLEGEAAPSVFTAAIVEGLDTGAADRDRDGRVSIPELHEYIADRMLAAEPKQTPLKWELGVESGLYLARNPRPIDPLPSELRGLIESGLPSGRAAAAGDLGRLLDSGQPGVALAARAALDALAEDDSRSVRAAARTALDTKEAASPSPSRATAEPPSTAPMPTPTLPDPPSWPPPRTSPATGGPRYSPAPSDRPTRRGGGRVLRRPFLGALLATGKRLRRIALWVVIAFFALALLGGLLEALGMTNATDSTDTAGGFDSARVFIPATEEITDTGLDVEQGEEVTIDAFGEAADNVNAPEQVFGPDGEPDLVGAHPGDPVQDMNHMALLGALGSEGPIIEIGSGGTFVADRSGRLVLGINDSNLDDNAGGYTADITVTAGS